MEGGHRFQGARPGGTVRPGEVGHRPRGLLGWWTPGPRRRSVCSTGAAPPISVRNAHPLGAAPAGGRRLARICEGSGVVGGPPRPRVVGIPRPVGLSFTEGGSGCVGASGMGRPRRADRGRPRALPLRRLRPLAAAAHARPLRPPGAARVPGEGSPHPGHGLRSSRRLQRELGVRGPGLGPAPLGTGPELRSSSPTFLCLSFLL